MKILAIDPGYDRCGVAVVAEGAVLYSCCIETSNKDAHHNRLAAVYTKLANLIDEWQPDALALETLFFSVNKKSALKVAEARGAVLTLAGNRNISVMELSPQEVKLSMTGVGNASKEQVLKMTALVTKTDLSDKIDDEVDAIALGLAALQHARVDNLRNGLAN